VTAAASGVAHDGALATVRAAWTTATMSVQIAAFPA
jgi:hypothetical protein